MNMIKRILSVTLAGMLLFIVPVSASGETDPAPILHMKRGQTDAEKLISQLTSDGMDVGEILKSAKVTHFEDAVGDETAVETMYVLDNKRVYIDEPDGEVHIQMDSREKEEYLSVDQEQKQKYDPDEDGYLKDGITPFYQNKFLSEEEAQQYITMINESLNSLAERLEIDLIPHHAYLLVKEIQYPDGQHFIKGSAMYGIKRNGLPVETAGLWSQVSSSGLFVMGETISVNWYGNDITDIYIRMYSTESEENVTTPYVSQDAAREKVAKEIEKIGAVYNTEPYADMCYMPVPDPRGVLYATFVPAWRFRFCGEYEEEDNCHRVNAYTGEVIR